MRQKLFLVALLGALTAPIVVAPISTAQAGDFDPSGRKKKKKTPPTKGPSSGPSKGPSTGPSKGPSSKGPSTPSTNPSTGPSKGPSPTGDEEKGPKSLESQIARYTAIVLSQPSAPFPLQKLASLHRERDGNLKKLIADFEARAAQTGDDAWAAKVALAGLYKQDGRYEDAIKTYEAASTEKPKESAPLVALGQLQADRGDKKAARETYGKALPLLKDDSEVEQTTRTLMQLSLDLKDTEAARQHHASLVKRSQGSLFVKAELGREMMLRGQFELAEGEFRELVKASSGDNRAMAPALRDLGIALAKQKKMSDAVDTLKKALNAAGSQTGVRSEILAAMAEAFRAEGKLAELVEILEKENGSDFQRTYMLGKLYEETGNVDKALTTYRKALGLDSTHIDTRVHIVHLLQTAGQLEEAIKEYEALVKSAPNNPDYVFELCETLIQRGDRPKALKLLKELEGRIQEPDVLAAVADFYERVEEKEKAMALLQRLATMGGGDPTFLKDLGDRYYQAGDKKKAVDTWAKIKTLIPNKARAAYELGEVYLNHDMTDEALASYREAVSTDPASVMYKKSLAIALERTAPGTPYAADRFGEAVRIWEELLLNAKNDTNLSRECRTHIVNVWSVQKELANRVTPLKQRFEADPPDLEAGRLLAEVQRKLGKLADSETTLRSLITKDPGDEASMLALERVLIQQQNLAGAIEILQKLADRNDKAARQYYQRMAQYAAELYKDDDAIKYAAKAVELSPEDAAGHQKLGDMYRKRQDFEKAISEYRQAISRNDRLYPVYFDLAELLLSSGDAGEADRLFRRVVRSSPDEELLSRAARMSMQINLGKGELESLERELLPIAVGNPGKPIYRRLLIELYGAMTLPLVQTVHHSEDAAKVDDARKQLAAIGSRGLKPLLDALADDRDTQQRVAIEVLAYVANPAAGPTLFNFATGQADKELRTRAMVAVGSLRDPAMLPKLEGLLAPSDRDVSLLPSDELALAAAWSVAKLQNPKADALLIKLLNASSPDVRAIAAVGLGLGKNKKHAPELMKLARAIESGPTARAAALLALGHLVSTAGLPADKDLTELVASNIDATDLTLRRAALVVSARLATPAVAVKGVAPKTAADPASAMEALAQGILSGDAGLREDAIAAAAALVDKTFGEKAEPLPVPDGKLQLRTVLAALMPDKPSDTSKTNVLVTLAPNLAKAAISAVSTSPEKAAAIADALSAGRVLAPFAAAAKNVTPELTEKAENATSTILAAATPGFTQLVKHPDTTTRTKAAQVLALSDSKDAVVALTKALEDGDDEVKRVVLTAVGDSGTPGMEAAVGKLAKSDPSWAVRIRAAETLGKIAASTRGGQGSKDGAIKTLTEIAKTDAYALVRETAAVSLHTLDPAAAASVLTDLSKSDGEQRVRETAQKLLDSKSAAAPAAAPPAG